MHIVPAVLLSTALFLAMVLNLALKPAVSARLTTTCLVVAAAGGLLIYGVGLAESTGSLLLTVIRTPLCVARMFVGVNELAAIAGTSPVNSPAKLILFWLLHLMAFYSMASAAMISLGAEALRHLRFLLSRRGDLTLIYGIHSDSIALGKECLAAGGNAVVFITEHTSQAVISDLNNMGMSVMEGPAAVDSEDKILRRLHAGQRKLTVYALDPAEDKNLFYALRLKDALERIGAEPRQTRITLPGAEDIIASMLQVSEDAYGFGYVNVFDKSTLSARAMIRLCPPWEFMAFSPDGRAKEDYECVIVGFGQHGQAALKQLVMNGQFAGSHFRAAVFSPAFTRESGYLLADSPELLKQYEILSYEADARGSEFYHYIGRRLSTLKLIAICTGDEEKNREISDNLMLYLKRRQAENICVVRCGEKGVRYQERVGSPVQSLSIYTRAFLSAEDADRDAILLNSIYDDSPRSDWDKWVACSSFSKMSSRASADFLPAFLRAAGVSREQVREGRWAPEGELLENLGETEHLRWNAFHFAMGYAPMSQEEFEANAATYIRCREEGKPCSVRITKNPVARTHACLIPWEELDQLSRREEALTGRSVNYKQFDINNVLAVSAILNEEKSEAKP